MNKILVGLMVLVLAAMAYVAYDAFLVDDPKPIAKIVKSKGLVNLRRDIDVVSGQADSLIYSDDQITTNKNSYARVVLIDGSTMVVGENSSIGFKNYDYDIDTRAVTGQLSFIKGALRLVTSKTSSKRSLLIRDQRGTTIGIRGTDVFVGNLVPEAMDVLLIESEKNVSVSSRQGKVELTSGQGTTVAAGEAPTDPKIWPQAKVAAALAMVFEG